MRHPILPRQRENRNTKTTVKLCGFLGKLQLAVEGKQNSGSSAFCQSDVMAIGLSACCLSQ